MVDEITAAVDAMASPIENLPMYPSVSKEMKLRFPPKEGQSGEPDVEEDSKPPPVAADGVSQPEESNNGLDEGRFAKKLKSLTDGPREEKLVQSRLLCSSRSISSDDLREKLAEAGADKGKEDEKESESAEVPSEVMIDAAAGDKVEVEEDKIEVEERKPKAEREETKPEASEPEAVESEVGTCDEPKMETGEVAKEDSEAKENVKPAAETKDKVIVETVVDPEADDEGETNMKAGPTNGEEVAENDTESKAKFKNRDLPAVEIKDKVESAGNTDQGGKLFLAACFFLLMFIMVFRESFFPPPPPPPLAAVPEIVDDSLVRKGNPLLLKLGKWRKKVMNRSKTKMLEETIEKTTS